MVIVPDDTDVEIALVDTFDSVDLGVIVEYVTFPNGSGKNVNNITWLMCSAVHHALLSQVLPTV